MVDCLGNVVALSLKNIFNRNIPFILIREAFAMNKTIIEII